MLDSTSVLGKAVPNLLKGLSEADLERLLAVVIELSGLSLDVLQGHESHGIVTHARDAFVLVAHEEGNKAIAACAMLARGEAEKKRIFARTANPRGGTPAFITKVREYVREHPEVLGRPATNIAA